MLFGGLPGIGPGRPILRETILPGPLAMYSYCFVGTSFVFFLLAPAMQKISWLVSVILADIGVALLVLGPSLAGFLGTDQTPLTMVGWLALVFSIPYYFVAGPDHQRSLWS